MWQRVMQGFFWGDRGWRKEQNFPALHEHGNETSGSIKCGEFHD
jgi:hypothetical protein